MKLQRRQPFNRITYVGLLLMPVANVARVVLERHSSIAEGPRDGIFGLLFGVGIGCLLLGMRRMTHRDASTDKSRCV